MPGFDVTGRVVDGLGVEAGVATVYARTGFSYDHAIAGLPFLSAATDDDPYQRGFAEQRRQQVDTSTEPGEQSLEGWWLRSQTDLSGGAGVNFLEPVSDAFTMRRFTSSVGVDVWEPADWHLLNDVASLDAMGAAAFGPVVARSGSTDYVFAGDGSGVYRDGSAVSGWTDTPTMLASAGSKVLAAHSTGIDVLSSPFTTPASLWTGAASAPKVWWVKQRIIAAIGASLYELSLAGGAWPAALYTHPNSDWVWTAVVETGTAILASGYAGASSAVYKFTLDTSGALPTLSKAVTAADLPVGETVHGMCSYLGSVCLGTNRGVRVAQATDDGSLVYGPLSYESSSTVSHFTGRDRFVWFGVDACPQLHDSDDDAAPGLVRLDLSSDDGAGRYAWAYDLRTYTAGTVKGVSCLTDGRLLFVGQTGSTSDVWREDTSNLVAAGGEVTTGLVRFNTLEPKMFRNVRLRGTLTSGSVGLYSWDGTNRLSLFTFTPSTGIGDLLNLPSEIPRGSLGLTFRLVRGSATTGPSVSGWQIRAMPAVERQQVLVVPLACFDVETDKVGNREGGEGQALSRFQSLLDAVSDGSVVTYQDLNTGERLTVVVEDLQFRQATPAGQFEGFGGVVLARLRTV